MTRLAMLMCALLLLAPLLPAQAPPAKPAAPKTAAAEPAPAPAATAANTANVSACPRHLMFASPRRLVFIPLNGLRIAGSRRIPPPYFALTRITLSTRIAFFSPACPCGKPGPANLILAQTSNFPLGLAGSTTLPTSA